MNQSVFMCFNGWFNGNDTLDTTLCDVQKGLPAEKRLVQSCSFLAMIQIRTCCHTTSIFKKREIASIDAVLVTDHALLAQW